jgi:hypothetical protein
MPDRDSEPTQLEDRLGREPTPAIAVHVARYGRHRGERLELGDDGPVADVSGMEDVIHASEVPQDRAVEQAVRVRDHPDTKDFSRHSQKVVPITGHEAPSP